ncbi:glycine cleavage system protein R [Roseibium suaedae]|uniref:Glycine cleavage system regulatory protein n=1 Tax=Roseibium suaedae TaxID=735517 RepID=A0A1M6ZSY4_9HYPH|nr:ACT domain-containing protein [Roseibium suaedae]SHL33529.1 Glycine cleavage system regulatory protein [Roseibium suaedae]
MPSHLVLTVIAKDRPGLVERLAEAIADAGGNWVESSMARLGGEFAGIVSVDIDEEAIGNLHQKFDVLLKDGIAITLRSDKARPEPLKGAAAHLDLISQDHPGILRRITRVLREHGVSIEHLETEVVPGSMSGEMLFKASADLRLPEGLSPAALSEFVQETAADMMADVNLID